MFKISSTPPGTGPAGPVLHGPSGPIFHAVLIAGLLGFGLFFDHTAAMTARGTQPALQVELGRERASIDVRQAAKWAIDSGDHGGQPFLVIDKQRARLFAFDAVGRLRASAPVLLGAVRGDAPEAPATPAGRFVTDAWKSAAAGALVWVDGDVALSMHALPSPVSPGRALQRLASDAVEDKRISDGSLHVARDFYQEFLAPLRDQTSVAYVLPEVDWAQGVIFRPAWDRLLAQSTRPPVARRPS